MKLAYTSVLSLTLALTLTLTLGGCVTMAQQDARKEAEAHCKRDGKIFTELDAGSQGGLFGTVTVTGQCLGPDDPGYAEANAAKATKAAKAATAK